jgi:hypothetical protein
MTNRNLPETLSYSIACPYTLEFREVHFDCGNIFGILCGKDLGINARLKGQ